MCDDCKLALGGPEANQGVTVDNQNMHINEIESKEMLLHSMSIKTMEKPDGSQTH